MECMYLINTTPNQTPIFRLLSIDSIVSFYVFDGITSHPNTPNKDEMYDFWQLFYMKTGRATYYTEDGIAHEVKAGQIIFRPPHMISSIKYDENTHNTIFIVSFKCNSQPMDVLKIAPVDLYGDEISSLSEVVYAGTRIFESVGSNSKKQGLQLKSDVSMVMVNYVLSSLERFLCMLCCRLTNAKYFHDESMKINKQNYDGVIVNSIKQYLSENVAGNPTLDDIAKYFNINKVSMMKLFKKEAGISIINYLKTLKINEAMRLITYTSLDFNEIARKIGFSDASYFTRVFKAQIGITPTEFSKRLSKKDNKYM